jgi:hypothetical protein
MTDHEKILIASYQIVGPRFDRARKNGVVIRLFAQAGRLPGWGADGS